MTTRHLAPALLAALLGGPATAADPRTDAHGDPLPDGAIARLGTARMAFGHGFVPVPPDYTTFLVATADRLRVHDLTTGRLVGTGPTPPETGRIAAVSADGKRTVVSRTRVVSVRAVPSGEVIRDIRPDGAAEWEQGLVKSLSADGKRLAVGRRAAGGGEVLVWDIGTDDPVARIPAPYPPPLTPFLSPDGAVVAVSGAAPPPPAPPGGHPPDAPEPTVAVYAVDTGEELFQARVNEPGPPAVAFSPDGKTLATGSGGGPIDLWEVPSGKLARTLLGRTGQGVRVAFSPDGTTLAAVGADGTIQRWSVPDGQRQGTTDRPAGLSAVYPLGVGFAPGGRVVAWGVAGATGVAWEAPSGKLLTITTPLPDGVVSVAFGAGGKEVVTAGGDGRVIRWDPATQKPTGPVAVRFPLPGPPGLLPSDCGRVPVLSLAADGTRGATDYPYKAVYDLTTGAELFALPPGGPAHRSASFPSADLSRVAVITPRTGRPASCRLTVWDIPGERKLMEADQPGFWPPAAGFSPDNARLVTVVGAEVPTPPGQPGTRITGWDVATGKRLGEVEGPASVNANGVSVRGGWALVAARGQLWAVDYEAGRIGEAIDVVRGGGPVGPVVFSPSGELFAVGVPLAAWSPDTPMGSGGVRVYDWPRGRVLKTFAGHAGPVTALRWSADGKVLASGSADTTVLLWDVAGLGEKK
jgi:WD40 repeat protein